MHPIQGLIFMLFHYIVKTFYVNPTVALVPFGLRDRYHHVLIDQVSFYNIVSLQQLILPTCTHPIYDVNYPLLEFLTDLLCCDDESALHIVCSLS